MILASHGIIGSQIQSFVGLLDAYPGAAAAYSLRKLSSTYTGSAIRVRRSSDNTEQNIGFSGANLDTSALTTFCSGTNGFVTTWFDQSSNGRDVTQTTAANQPQIVSSGSVINVNSKPSIRFQDGTDFLRRTTSSGTSTSNTMAVVFKFNRTGYYGVIMSIGDTNASCYGLLGWGHLHLIGQFILRHLRRKMEFIHRIKKFGGQQLRLILQNYGLMEILKQ